MDLFESALRIQQTQGQLPPPEFARTLTKMITTTLINAGVDGGVSPRQVLRIYEVQPALIDSDTSALDSPHGGPVGSTPSTLPLRPDAVRDTGPDVLITVLTISSPVCPATTPAASTASEEPRLEL